MDGCYARQHTIDAAIDLLRAGAAPAATGAADGPRACDDHAPRTAWRTGAAGAALFCIAALLLTGALGCADRVSLIPNSDPGFDR